MVSSSKHWLLYHNNITKPKPKIVYWHIDNDKSSGFRRPRDLRRKSDLFLAPNASKKAVSIYLLLRGVRQKINFSQL